jgi:hypothetical protein
MSATGCTLCVQRITGSGFPSYCGDFSKGPTDPGRRIQDRDMERGPHWCPKKGEAA